MHGHASATYEAADWIYGDPVHHRIGPAKPAAAPAASFLHLRRNRPVLVLLPRTKAWMASLPPRVRPTSLAAQFARIANHLCAAWDDPAECRQVLDDLLIDRRGGRKGFPKPVARELQLLALYYCVLHPFASATAPCPALAAA